MKAHAQGIDYQHPRGLQQSQMAALLQGDWISKAQNLGSLGFSVVTPIASVLQTRSGVLARRARYAGTIGPSYRYRSSGV